MFWAGAIFLFLCGISDSIDGEVARLKDQITKLGGFLDSTIDRVNEFIIYFGLFFYYYDTTNYVTVWILLAIFGSMMVSYTRARAEAAGVKMGAVGIAERAERMLFLAAVTFTSQFFLGLIGWGVAILAGLSHLTVLQRIAHFQREISKDKTNVSAA